MLHGRRVVGVKSMPLEKRAQLTLHSFQLKVGIAHLHMSLAIENAMGLMSLLVTTCNSAADFSKGGLQMDLCSQSSEGG